MSVSADVKTTPLYELHQRLGANLVDFAGYLMPLRYQSEIAEHQAVRTSAGLFDISHMGEIFVSGQQAAAALDHALVGDITALAIGRARYTMICDAAGGVLDDLIVYRLDDTYLPGQTQPSGAQASYLVVANASNVTTVREALLDRAKTFDALVEDRSDAYALIAVQGPRSQQILARLTDAPLDGLKYYAILNGIVAGFNVLIGRTGYTGEDGFELFANAADAVALWTALQEAGGDELRPAGLSARDTLRLEAGMPLYGNELSTATTPYDAGLGRVVKLGKPHDFVGRAALERLAETAPARRLVGLVARGRRAPRHGYPVVLPDGTPCGVVTSGAPSPTLGTPIAMAYVDVAVLESDDPTVLVDIRGKHEAVDVVALPFYKRP